MLIIVKHLAIVTNVLPVVWPQWLSLLVVYCFIAPWFSFSHKTARDNINIKSVRTPKVTGGVLWTRAIFKPNASEKTSCWKQLNGGI